MFDKITWLGHSGILIEAEKNVYFDPFNVPDGLPKADVIFLTHPHYDHCSPDDVAKISTEETLIVGTADTIAKLPPGRSLVMAAGDSKICAGFKVEAKPAYNIKKPYHPKSKGWVGFLVDIGGYRAYHAGDTDAVPEMKSWEPDVAFLPVDALYHWDGHNPLGAAFALRAKRLLPVHFGTVCGSRTDAAKWLDACAKAGMPGEFYRRERTGASPQVLPELAPAAELALK